MNEFDVTAFSDKIVGPELRCWPVLRAGIVHIPRRFHILFCRPFDDVSHHFTCHREEGTRHYVRVWGLACAWNVPNGKGIFCLLQVFLYDFAKSYKKLAKHVVTD